MRVLTILTAAVVAALAPSAAATAAPTDRPLKAGKNTPKLRSASMCATPKLVHPFTRWNDAKPYFLVPGGDFEAPAAGWKLAGASVTDGGFESAHSLRLRSGDSATTTVVCVGHRYPRFRLFARNAGSRRAGLAVEVIFLNSDLSMRITRTKVLKMGAKWAPTRRMPLPAGLTGVAGTGNLAPVAFRFTALGRGGDWHVDDVYVDPYARG